MTLDRLLPTTHCQRCQKPLARALVLVVSHGDYDVLSKRNVAVGTYDSDLFSGSHAMPFCGDCALTMLDEEETDE